MIRKAAAEDISFVEEIYNEITSNEEIIKLGLNIAKGNEK